MRDISMHCWFCPFLGDLKEIHEPNPNSDVTFEWVRFLSSTQGQFSIIIEPLFESYNGMVSTASVEDLCRSTLSWLDQHCSLPSLRPSESSTTDLKPKTCIPHVSYHPFYINSICHVCVRSVVLSSLRLLSTTTSILTDPSLLPEQATLAVTQGDPAAALDHSLQPATRDNIHPMWLWWTDSVETRLKAQPGESLWND